MTDFADAILARLIHNAHRLPLDSASLRKTRNAGNQKGPGTLPSSTV